MTDQHEMIDVLDARVQRREERRDFFRQMGGKALIGSVAAAASATAVNAQAAPTDADILNFALNLEYLEAQFYSFASFGRGLDANLLTGTGTQGGVTGGRQVPFADNVVRQYAREIANDEIAHVRFLRSALGAATVAQPALDIGSDPNGAFSQAAVAAGIITQGQSFDPYANDDNFLLGAYIFEDVGVTAYKGASPLITSRTFLEAAAGILAAEAYHAGLIRTVLYGRGVQTPALRTNADRISNARDSLDGTTDLDQGISPVAPTTTAPFGTPPAGSMASNIVPLDANGLAFSRSPGQVLNIVYLNRLAVTRGGFFPAGVNGTNATFRTSGAN